MIDLSKKRNARIALGAILILALALRLGMCVFLGFNSPPDQDACGRDTIDYELMAWSAANGRHMTFYPDGRPTAFRAPGYPVFLAGLYKLTGRAYWVNRLALSLVGTVTCWLVFLLACRLGRSVLVALIAALLSATLPLQFYWSGHFMSETLATFLGVAATLAFVDAFGRTTVRGLYYGVFIGGLIAGLAALTRPAGLLLPIIMAWLWIVTRCTTIRRAIILSVVACVGVGLVVAPWTTRNWILLDRPVLIATNGGAVFWGANNSLVAEPGEYWGGWLSSSQVDKQRKEIEVWSLENEADQDRRERQIGVEWVQQNTGSLPMLLLGKLSRLVNPFQNKQNLTYRYVTAMGYIFLLPVSVVGMFMVLSDRKARRVFVPVNAQLLNLLATTIVFYASDRLRSPYEPYLAIYASIALVALMRRTPGIGLMIGDMDLHAGTR